MKQQILAIIGYSMLLLVSIVSLVVLLEFDMEGNLAKRPENYLEGTITLTEGTPMLKADTGTFLLKRTDAFPLEDGAFAIAYAIPGTQSAILESQIPHVPRNINDLLIACALLVCSMLLVAFDPSVAYFDIFQHA